MTENELLTLIFTNLPNLSVALIVLYFMATGKLIPRSVVEELVQQTTKNLVHEIKEELADLIRREVSSHHESQ